jgi:hypothetical protein
MPLIGAIGLQAGQHRFPERIGEDHRGMGAGQRLNQVQIPTPVGQLCPADFSPHQS